MQPIREILKVKVDPNRNPTQLTKTLNGTLGGFPPETAILHPEGMMAIEDFAAGETIRWSFPHSEFQYILKGKAEMVYSLAPWHDEEKRLTVEPGDVYLVPNGAVITFKVAPGAPLRKMCVVMPAYMGYLEVPPKNVVKL